MKLTREVKSFVEGWHRRTAPDSVASRAEHHIARSIRATVVYFHASSPADPNFAPERRGVRVASPEQHPTALDRRAQGREQHTLDRTAREKATMRINPLVLCQRATPSPYLKIIGDELSSSLSALEVEVVVFARGVRVPLPPAVEDLRGRRRFRGRRRRGWLRLREVATMRVG